MVKSTKSSVWVDFVYQNIICRYGCVGQIVTDNGELNSELGLEMERKYRVQVSFTTTYHPQGNAPVERGHLPFRNSLEKSIFQKVADSIEAADLYELKKEWVMYFYSMLWADRVTVKRSTGFAAYNLMFGNSCVLPVELDAESWYTSNWKYPMTTEELLYARVKQLARRNEDLELARIRLERSKQRNKDYFDKTKNIRKRKLEEGDLVLLYESKLENQMSRKFINLWTGPYVVLEVREDGAYLIGQLDGSANEVVAGNRVKLFKPRKSVIQGTDDDDLIPVDVELSIDNPIESIYLSRLVGVWDSRSSLDLDPSN
jgi:hypothetical protein